MSTKIDLEILMHGPGEQTNFTTHLLKLIFKADLYNREKIRRGFPNAVKTVETYLKTGDIIDLPTD